MPSSHDQSFKNLILDYPQQALELFAPEEHAALEPGARIVPIRQEQLKERLGERFRELDVPLLVEWPDGRREALLFVLEEESRPSRFSIGRLAHYCLDFVDIYTELTDNERQRYEQEYQQESDEMAGFAERFTTIGLERGREEGRRQEAISMLTRFLTKRFGPMDDVTQKRIQGASVEQIEAWSDRVLDADTLEEVFEPAGS